MALPITVLPSTPASAVSPPPANPISPAKTIAPLPSVSAGLTFSPANSSVLPITSLKVIVPVPEITVRTSAVPSASIAPAKLTSPPPLVPVVIVVVPSFLKFTPAVLKVILFPAVAMVAAVPVTFIFPPAVA